MDLPTAIMQIASRGPAEPKEHGHSPSGHLVLVFRLEDLLPILAGNVQFCVVTHSVSPDFSADPVAWQADLCLDTGLDPGALTLVIVPTLAPSPQRLVGKWFLFDSDALLAIIEASPPLTPSEFIVRVFPVSALNPYQSERPVVPKMFFGRRDDIADITNGSSSFAIFGARRMGKTCLAEGVARTLRTQRLASIRSASSEDCRHRVVSLNMNQVPLESLWQSAFRQIGVIEQDMEERSRYRRAFGVRDVVERTEYEWLTEKLQSRYQDSLWLLDECDSALQVDRKARWHTFQRLQALVDDPSARVRIVLLGYEALHDAMRSGDFPLNRASRRVREKQLQALDSVQVRDLLVEPLSSLGIKVASKTESAQMIHAATHGLPSIVQDVCGTLLRLPSVGGTQLVTLANIEEALRSPELAKDTIALFDQARAPLARLIGYISVGADEVSVVSTLTLLRRYALTPTDDVVRSALDQLVMYSVLEQAGDDEYSFSTELMRDQLRRRLQTDREKSILRTLVSAVQRSLREDQR